MVDWLEYKCLICKRLADKIFKTMYEIEKNGNRKKIGQIEVSLCLHHYEKYGESYFFYTPDLRTLFLETMLLAK